MKKLLTVLAICAVVVSCSKKSPSPEYLYAASLHNSYPSYYYKGEFKTADVTFYKGVDAFVRMDSLCNVSRMYITRYVLAEKDAQSRDIELAFNYANIGKCESEMAIVGFLQGDPIGDKIIEKPYSLINDFNQSGDYSQLITYAESQMNDYPSSSARIYRLVADKLIDTDPKTAYSFAKKARKIDSAYGWTLGLSRDLSIMINANTKLGEPTTDLLERKRLLDAKLTK